MYPGNERSEGGHSPCSESQASSNGARGRQPCRMCSTSSARSPWRTRAAVIGAFQEFWHKKQRQEDTSCTVENDYQHLNFKSLASVVGQNKTQPVLHSSYATAPTWVTGARGNRIAPRVLFNLINRVVGPNERLPPPHRLFEDDMGPDARDEVFHGVGTVTGKDVLRYTVAVHSVRGGL